MKKLIFQEEQVLIKLINQKSVKSAIIGFFKDKNFKKLDFEKLACNGCHDISMMCCELENIAIFKTKNIDYRCIL